MNLRVLSILFVCILWVCVSLFVCPCLSAGMFIFIFCSSNFVIFLFFPTLPVSASLNLLCFFFSLSLSLALSISLCLFSFLIFPLTLSLHSLYFIPLLSYTPSLAPLSHHSLTSFPSFLIILLSLTCFRSYFSIFWFFLSLSVCAYVWRCVYVCCFFCVVESMMCYDWRNLLDIRCLCLMKRRGWRRYRLY